MKKLLYVLMVLILTGCSATNVLLTDGGSYFSSDSGEERGSTDCPQDPVALEALLACEYHVRGLMQTPDAAQYHRCNNLRVEWRGNKFVVHSFFDVPNTAGPYLRTGYSCALNRTETGILNVYHHTLEFADYPSAINYR